MKIGKIRINTLVNFLGLYAMTLKEYRLPTVEEIMQYNPCCKSNAYNYLRALRHLFPKEVLEEARKRRAARERSSVQTTL